MYFKENENMTSSQPAFALWPKRLRIWDLDLTLGSPIPNLPLTGFLVLGKLQYPFVLML